MDDPVHGRHEQGPGAAVVQVFLPAAEAAGRDGFFGTDFAGGAAADRAERRRDDRDQVQAIVADRTAFDLPLAGDAILGQYEVRRIFDDVPYQLQVKPPNN